MSSQDDQIPPPVSFGLADCDELLNFPYDEYRPKPVNVEDSVAAASSTDLEIIKEVPGQELIDIACDPEEIQEVLQLFNAYREELFNTLNFVATGTKTNQRAQYVATTMIAREKAILTKVKLKKTYSKPISLFAAPYFRDGRGRVPAVNDDCKAKMKTCPVDAYLMTPKPWLSAECEKLRKGVADSVLNEALKPYKLRRDHLRSKLNSANLPESEEPVIHLELENIEWEIEKLQQQPLADLFDLAQGKIDWMTVSATALEGSRSPEQCECMWKNFLTDDINKTPFTPAEDKCLKRLAKEFNEKDWDKVADLLNTGRTALQCLERYQISLNDHFTKSYWTPEEDELLVETVERLKIGDYIPWNDVCCYIEGRTRQQIINRYERSVSKDIVKSSWSTREDAMIMACVKLLGCKWNKMRNFLPRRSAYAIRERYCNSLDPTLRIGNWSLEEDKQLIHYIKEFGYGKWGKIAAHMPGRTDNMCLFRADRLLYHTKQKTLPDRKKNANKTSALISKLKPFAPSKACVAQNFRLKEMQTMAFDLLLRVLQKIKPDTDFDTNINTFELSSFREPFLYQIQNELKKSIYDDNHAQALTHQKRRTPTGIPKHKGRHLRSSNFINGENGDDELVLDDDDDDENLDDKESDVDEPEKEIEYSESEVAFTKEVIQRRFAEAGPIMPLHQGKVFTACSLKHHLESKLYLKYLQREFRVSETVKNEEENYVLNGKNLALSVQEMTVRFINAYSPDGFQVQPPTVASMSALEVMRESKLRIGRMADFVNHSKPYLEYLFGEETEPTCLHCTQKHNELLSDYMICNPARGSPCMQTLHKPLKDRYFVPEERLVNALATENSFWDDAPCVCEKLKESKAAVTLLRKRLLSIFLWPYLLSKTYFTDDHYALLEETEFPEQIEKTRTQVKKTYKGRRKRKRGLKKGCKRSVSVKKAYGIKVPPAAVLKKTKNSEIASEYLSGGQKIKLEKEDSSAMVQNNTSPGVSVICSSPSPKNNNKSAFLSLPKNTIGPKINLNLSDVPVRISKRRRVR